MFEGWIEAFEITSLFQQVVIAFAIGGLLGLEREKEPGKFAGLRTLAILCASGPLFVAIASDAGLEWLVGLYIVLAIALAIGIALIRFRLTGGEVGFTTSVTVVMVAVLGLLVGYEFYFEATAVAIITAFILAEKESLTSYVENLTYTELTDAMKLAALVFILYPILPADPVDPFEVVYLREVLLFAIFVLSIEFAAYISMRQFGAERGLQITGFLAGFANSFATAAVMARLGNKSKQALDAASAGLMLSVNSMIIRNVGLASIIAFPLFAVLWMPGVIMLAIAFAVAWYLLWRGESDGEFEFDLDSPFSLQAAVKFSAFYVAIVLVSVLAEELWGDAGVLATAYIGGLVSSAAVAVSAGSLYSTGALGLEAAAGMVILGIVASLSSKIILVEFINGNMRGKGVLPMAIIGLVGLGVWFATGMIPAL